MSFLVFMLGVDLGMSFLAMVCFGLLMNEKHSDIYNAIRFALILALHNQKDGFWILLNQAALTMAW